MSEFFEVTVLLIIHNHHCFDYLKLYCSNPTPNTSHLPKWNEAREFPVNYYRFGNLNFEEKPLFGSETGGIFENRAKIWREITKQSNSNAQKDEL